MIKLTNCNFDNTKVGFSFPAGSTIECLKCGYKQKITQRLSGSVCCPECDSKDIQVSGEKK